MPIIWIDGDACPKPIKTITFNASLRTRTFITIVSAQIIPLPPHSFIKLVQVPPGIDASDQYIISHVHDDDLVITNDLLLAQAIILKKALALNTRGTLYNSININQLVSIRNFHEERRETGDKVQGPPPLSKAHIQLFAQQLDKWLAHHPSSN